jgi:transposase-like protein
MPQPPKCPVCPEQPFVWKDMTTATWLSPDNWRWHCTGCKREWTPTAEQKLEYA